MLKFIFPIDGDILNSNDGRVEDGTLYFTARLFSDFGVPTVNGKRAEASDTECEYTVELAFPARYNTVSAEIASEKCKIDVQFLRDAVGYYQFFIDDNIWFFRDIYENDYASIYENPYIAFWRSMHDKYGTLVHMHVYYETERFDLSMMPDKYKSEWQEAAKWLRFTFHARGDKPDYPHRDATYEETKSNIELVNREIIRFAGEELLSPATVPHWNEVSIGAARAFRDCGHRIVPGFELSRQYEHLGIGTRKRDFWYDREEDMYTCYGDICLNKNKLEDIVPILDGAKADPATSGFIYMMTHEQYFYEGFEDYVPNYVAYLPDFCERMETAIRWAVDNGYKCKWLEDIILDQ